MKKGIHPNYQETKFICACGEEFVSKSTKAEVHTEVCSKCHPFFTGKQGNASKKGRIEKFNQKYGFNKEEK